MAEGELPQIVGPVQFPDFSVLSVTGIYFLLRNEVVVYVGQAKSVRQRIGQHISEGRKLFDSVSFIPCDLLKLDAWEKRYIKLLMPEYNQCSLSSRLKAETAVRAGHGTDVSLDDLSAPHEVKAARFLGISMEEFKEHKQLGNLPKVVTRAGRAGAWYPPRNLKKFAAKHLSQQT